MNMCASTPCTALRKVGEELPVVQFLVIKCGGSVFENLPDAFYEQVVRLQKEGLWHPVIVHGGGPSISAWLDQLSVPSTFVNGLRVTTAEVLEAVEMVLSGKINK